MSDTKPLFSSVAILNRAPASTLRFVALGIIGQPEFYTARDLRALYGFSPGRLERHIKDHDFPQPIKFGIGAARHWRRAAVLAWKVQWDQKNLEELVRLARPHQGAPNHGRGQSAQSAEEVK